jgi:fatty-acid desaturase
MNFKYFGFIVLPITVLGIMAIASMILTSSYSWLLATFTFWVLLSGFGIATGFHRVFSHNCYEPRPVLDNLLLYFGSLACQSSSLTWVATHMGYHHPYADREKDLHSPLKGFWHAFMGWTFRVNQQNVNHKYAVKLMRRKNHVFVHKHYFSVVWGSILMFLLVFGWKFVLYGYCIAAFISILQDNLVNVLGHCPKLGYRNFDTDDRSSNFAPLGYLGWGQGWHNNHHYYPQRFNFGVKWWELDLCIIFLPLIKLGSKI